MVRCAHYRIVFCLDKRFYIPAFRCANFKGIASAQEFCIFVSFPLEEKWSDSLSSAKLWKELFFLYTSAMFASFAHENPNRFEKFAENNNQRSTSRWNDIFYEIDLNEMAKLVDRPQDRIFNMKTQQERWFSTQLLLRAHTAVHIYVFLSTVSSASHLPFLIITYRCLRRS